uniref:Uncharacterized protein n=1 Tax=Amazona collaria TaxID=241587 RepID=A0A8B9FPT9_9PSIT
HTALVVCVSVLPVLAGLCVQVLHLGAATDTEGASSPQQGLPRSRQLSRREQLTHRGQHRAERQQIQLGHHRFRAALRRRTWGCWLMRK